MTNRTAEAIETLAADLKDRYGTLPGKNAVGVFPTDDDPPAWVNVYGTRPLIDIIAAELGYYVESVEQIDAE